MLPPAMSTPQRLSDRKREAILQAAIVEFRTHGFEATSMDKVAASAEVSKRTVYNHFPSKDDLFAQILLQLWECSCVKVEQGYRADTPLRGQLLELLGKKIGMFADANFLDLARVAIAETIHSPERAQAMVSKFSEREEGITAWISAAQADGRLKAVDVTFAAHQLQGLLKSFAFWPQITMGQPPLTAVEQRQVVESAADMFLGYYATGSDAN